MTNILVVEDNAGLRRLIGIHLRRAGYEVSEAADGQAALDLWSTAACISSSPT